jgi:hypothetical protein
MMIAVAVPMTAGCVMVMPPITGDGVPDDPCRSCADHCSTGIDRLNWSAPCVVGGHAPGASRKHEARKHRLRPRETAEKAVNSLHDGSDETCVGLFKFPEQR